MARGSRILGIAFQLQGVIKIENNFISDNCN